MSNESKRTDVKPRQSSGAIEIREMELDDLSPVYRLGERLFTAEAWPNLYRTWDEYELVERFGSDGDLCLVAELDDTIIGFAIGTVIEKRRSAWTYGWLLWLGVETQHTRRGIGSRLFQRLTEQLIEQGARMMLIDTESEKLDALRFFRKHGFGQPIEHVYLTRNLTMHPKYLRRRPEDK